MSAAPATPAYAVGDVVTYRDRQNRIQIGEVLRIAVSWHGEADPLIIFTLRHPSYLNQKFHTTADYIIGLSNFAEDRQP